MSYILEALRRADVERERGGVPGLHAQPTPMFALDSEARVASKPWVWLVVGLSVGLLGALAWRMIAAPAQQPPVNVAANVATSAPTPTPVAKPAPAIEPTPAAPVTTTPPAPTVAATPPSVPAVAPAPAAARAQEPPPPPAKAPPPPRTSTPARTVQEAPPAPAPKAATAQPPALPVAKAVSRDAVLADPRVYKRDELPSDIRAQLPNLTVGGSMYSDKPALRMLILNGQLYHEGDSPAPGLVLEQIRLKTAVLRYKGYRYEMTY